MRLLEKAMNFYIRILNRLFFQYKKIEGTLWERGEGTRVTQCRKFQSYDMKSLKTKLASTRSYPLINRANFEQFKFHNKSTSICMHMPSNSSIPSKLQREKGVILYLNEGKIKVNRLGKSYPAVQIWFCCQTLQRFHNPTQQQRMTRNIDSW